MKNGEKNNCEEKENFNENNQFEEHFREENSRERGRNVKEVHDLCLLCWLVDFLAILMVHCDFNGRKYIKASFFLYIFIDIFLYI